MPYTHPADDMAGVMFEGLADFVERDSPKSLTHVTFMIYQQSMLQFFINKVKARIEESSNPSSFHKMCEYITMFTQFHNFAILPPLNL